jgi:thymidylate synthase (FAD)
MKVKIINPDEAKLLFHYWGEASKCCYATETDTPDTVGKGCMYSGHFSGSRSRYILFQIDDCPRFTIDQAVRHEVGVMKNVQSFRYVGKNSFAYEIPEEIKDNPVLLFKYNKHMMNTIELYAEIQDYVYEKTNSHERANEQARYVLPMATHSSFVFGLTIEALIHFMNMRLCVRTEDVHRKLALLMKDATIEILPELKSRLVPNCQALLWCPEGKKSCGSYPTKKELQEKLSLITKDNI